MSKKNFFVSFFAFVLLTSGTVFAQNSAPLPSAGITPENPFYFLDKFEEVLREFFTFSSGGKARLEITFAKERIAEIKTLLETKGIDSQGIPVAETRLQSNLERVNTILSEKKAGGEDVSALAKELDDEFEGPRSALEDAFKMEKQALDDKEKELKAKIHEARLAGDMALVATLEKELIDGVKAKKELLDTRKNEQENAMREKEDKLAGHLADKDGATKAISEAEKAKQELLSESAKNNVIVPAESFKKFDQLLSQAKELFDKENYQGATQLAKQSEKSLEDINTAAEDLKNAKEQESELKDKAEEKIREGNKEEVESIKKEQENIEKEVHDAEEKLLDAGKEVEN